MNRLTSLLRFQLLLLLFAPACDDSARKGRMEEAKKEQKEMEAKAQAAKKQMSDELDQLRTVLSSATSELSKAVVPNHNVPCPEEVLARVGPTWNDSSFVATSHSLDFLLQKKQMPVYPKMPEWQSAISGSVATGGRGYHVLKALEWLARENQYTDGKDFYQRTMVERAEELSKALAKPIDFVVLLRTSWDKGPKNIEGETVKTDTEGEKSLKIEGGSTGGRVVVIDTQTKQVVCSALAMASTTSGYGNRRSAMGSDLIRDIGTLLGRGLFKPNPE